MAIVTLTTDYGTSDHYVASLKGHLLSRNPRLTIVDVSHDIRSFNIVQAAFVLRHAFPSFPKSSIHSVVVQNRTEKQRLLCVRRKGHYFLLPDNGIVTLMFDEIESCVAVHGGENGSSSQRLIAECAQKIVDGMTLEEIGTPITDYVQRIHLNPVVTNALIRGAAIHIDNYDNIIFNITRDLFESVSNGRPFKLYYKRHDPVTEFHEDYYDVPVGEVVCRFNDRGFLELGMNMGRAASLLGINLDDTVQIHFEDQNG